MFIYASVDQIRLILIEPTWYAPSCSPLDDEIGLVEDERTFQIANVYLLSTFHLAAA